MFSRAAQLHAAIESIRGVALHRLGDDCVTLEVCLVIFRTWYHAAYCVKPLFFLLLVGRLKRM